MELTDRKRRAPAGCEAGPCPGCKTGTNHPKGDICRDCRRLLDRATAIVAAHQAQTDEAWFQYPRFAHWAPGYYFGVEFSDRGEVRGARERMHQAFHDLILAAAKDTKFPDDYADGVSNELYRKHGLLIRRPSKWRSEQQSSRDHVLLPVKLAQAINALDRAMVVALVSVSEGSYSEGSDLLRKLAAGDTTLAEFEADVKGHVKEMQRVRAQDAAEPAGELTPPDPDDD